MIEIDLKNFDDDLNKISMLKNYLQSIENGYKSDKCAFNCLPLLELFYNEKGKEDWLQIIQLIGMGKSTKNIAKTLKLAEITIDKKKEAIYETITTDMTNWKFSFDNNIFFPLFIPPKERKGKYLKTKTIEQFAQIFKLEIIIILKSKGLHSYLSIGDLIAEEVKCIFDLDNYIEKLQAINV